jgi:hypothetical protein
MNNMNSCELLGEIKNPWFRIFSPSSREVHRTVGDWSQGEEWWSGGGGGRGGGIIDIPRGGGKQVRRLQLFPVVVLSHKWIHLYPLVGIPV